MNAHTPHIWLAASTLLVLACASTPPTTTKSGDDDAPAQTEAAPEDDDATETEPTPMQPTPDGFETTWSDEIEFFEATLRIAASPGSKRLQPVTLERDDGESWIVAYRPDDQWTRWKDERVRVSGKRYQPGANTQHVMAQHFAVESIRAAHGKGLGPKFTGPSQTLEGTVQVGAGEGKSQVLVLLEPDDGASRVVSYGHTPTWEALDGERVRATGRPFEPGHPQRAGGPHFHVDSLIVLDGDDASPSDAETDDAGLPPRKDEREERTLTPAGSDEPGYLGRVDDVVVRIEVTDPAPENTKLAGERFVWAETDDGRRWRIAEAAEKWLEYDGEKLRVTGQLFDPNPGPVYVATVGGTILRLESFEPVIE